MKTDNIQFCNNLNVRVTGAFIFFWEFYAFLDARVSMWTIAMLHSIVMNT